MIKVVACKEMDTSSLREFADAFLESIEDNSNRVYSVCLGGSHSIGLAGAKADIDLTFHYIPSLENVLSLTPRPLTFRASEKIKRIERAPPAPHAYGHAGHEYEPSFVPLFLPTSREPRPIVGGLYSNDWETIDRFVREIPIFQQDPYGVLRDFACSEMAISSDAIIARQSIVMAHHFAPLLSFSIEQANSETHERASNASDNFTEIVEKTEEQKPQDDAVVSSLARGLVYGVYAGLSCVHVVSKCELSRDMWHLFSVYADAFDAEEKELIRISYEHKVDKRAIDSPSAKHRELYFRLGGSIKAKLAELVAKSAENSSYPRTLTPRQQADNAERLNAIVRKTYGLDKTTTAT